MARRSRRRKVSARRFRRFLKGKRKHTISMRRIRRRGRRSVTYYRRKKNPITQDGSGSWVVSRKSDNSVIGEFFDPKSLRVFDPRKVRIETAKKYLVRLNRDIKSGKTWMYSKKNPGNREAYEAGYAGYIPSPDDLPDNIPYYRRHAAVKSLLRHLGLPESLASHHAIHGSGIFASDRTGRDLKDFQASLAHLLKDLKAPEAPARKISYRSEPVKNIEKRSKALFDIHFKQKWPDKRLGSKFAKEKWEQVKAQAEKMAEAEYANEYKEYSDHIGKLESEYGSKYKAYKQELDAHEKSLSDLKRLAEEE